MSQTLQLKICGRFVQGDVYKGSDKDADGNPRLVKKPGANFGQPTVQFYQAVAVPKRGTTHWSQTPEGKQIQALGAQSFPRGEHAAATFAWKVSDGDDTVPNRKGNKPCDQEGFAGCWIFKFTSGFAPRLVYMSNGVLSELPDSIRMKPGDYVEVLAEYKSNESVQQPGLFAGPKAIFLAGVGEAISQGLDLSGVGFGASQLPPGVAAPDADELPAFGNTKQGATHVQSRPDLLDVQDDIPPPDDDDMPPPPSGPTMTDKAGGKTYEQFIAKGWTDAKLIAAGYMVA
jgi:hypothetical protein